MTKQEAVEKIVQKCESYNSCGDCPLYVRGNFTKCALAIMIGVIPVRWEIETGDSAETSVKKYGENDDARE